MSCLPPPVRLQMLREQLCPAALLPSACPRPPGANPRRGARVPAPAARQPPHPKATCPSSPQRLSDDA
eukprot:3810544-Pyramimonas_sp.AAC.1